MSYRLDLDEYTTEALEKELGNRAKARATGNCDYCGRKQGVEPSCKFPERHSPLVLTCTHYNLKQKKCSRCTRKGCAACSLCTNCQP